MAWNMHQTSFSNCLAVGTKMWWFAWRCGRCVGMGPRGIFRNGNCCLLVINGNGNPLPHQRRAAGVTNYHPPPVAATSRFENMARKQPRCAVGPPCGRRVPGQLHLDRFITHLPRCPLSWYTHPTYTPLPPAPSSLPWFRRATRIENAFWQPARIVIVVKQ